MTDLKLSVLDLLPLRRGQTSRQALLASKSLAQVADRLGYTRYWVAEHHNRDAIVATVPSVLIPFIAEGTTQIRLGAGGVMLANHAPFAVAEQFALLQEMFPGRIDLGLGRAPGTDQLTAALLRQLLPDDGVANYSRDVTFLRNLLGVGDTPLGRNHAVRIGEHDFQLHATPAMTTPTDMWLLGSSAHSAKIAARLGLPYAFANHFDAPNMDVTIRTYRKHYEASKAFPEPKTFVPVNVVVAESEEEARRLSLPQRLNIARQRTGSKATPLLTVEDMQNYSWTTREFTAPPSGPDSLIVGTPDRVASMLTSLAARVGTDEIMICPVASAHAGDDLARDERREDTLRLLAEALL